MTCREFGIAEYMRHGTPEADARRILANAEKTIPQGKRYLDMEATELYKAEIRESINMEFNDPDKLQAQLAVLREQYERNLSNQ